MPRTWQRAEVFPCLGCGTGGWRWVLGGNSPGTRLFNCSFALQSSLVVTGFVVYCYR